MGADFLRPFTFNGIRFVMGALSLIPVILIFERGKADKAAISATVKYGVLAGTVLCIASNLQQYGVELTGSAGKSGFITGLYTVLVPLIYFIMGRKTGIPVLAGALCALSGLYFLCGVGEAASFGIGDVMLIIGAVFWALHIIILDKASDMVPPLKFSFTQFAVCALISLVCAPVFEWGNFTLHNVSSAIIPLLYCGIGSVGVAYTCQLLGQRGADPTFATIVLSTETVFAMVGEAIIYPDDVKIGIPGYIGCALIFTGIILSQIPTGNGEVRDGK